MMPREPDPIRLRARAAAYEYHATVERRSRRRRAFHNRLGQIAETLAAFWVIGLALAVTATRRPDNLGVVVIAVTASLTIAALAMTTSARIAAERRRRHYADLVRLRRQIECARIEAGARAAHAVGDSTTRMRLADELTILDLRDRLKADD